MLQRYFKRHWLLVSLLSVSMLVPALSEVAQAKPRSQRQKTSQVAKLKPAQTSVKAQQALSAQTPSSTESTNTAPSATAAPAEADTFTPGKDEVHLLLKLGERKVYVYRGTTLLNKYPVAIGKKGWETPQGNWTVQLMQKNPGWTNFKTGEVMPPGPDNPLGERWIGFWTDGKDEIGFHGTTNLKSIGQAASHGCVRMTNRDVKMLYKLVRLGTVVRVRA